MRISNDLEYKDALIRFAALQEDEDSDIDELEDLAMDIMFYEDLTLASTVMK